MTRHTAHPMAERRGFRGRPQPREGPGPAPPPHRPMNAPWDGFDMRTLLLAFTLTRLTQAGVLLYVGHVHRGYRPAREWSVGALLSALGLLLATLRGLASPGVTVAAANALLIPGWMIFDFGIVRATGHVPPWRLGWGCCAGAVALIAWTSADPSSYALRVFAYAGVSLIFDALVVFRSLSASRTPRTPTLRLLATLFLLHIVSSIWRTVGAVAGHTTSLLAVTPSQGQYFLTALVLNLAITVLLVVLTSQILQEQLSALARTDPLTGAANRRQLAEVVEREAPRAARHGIPMACLLLDIDHFKDFNDRYGHTRGDEMLVALSVAARGFLRSEDTWCRYGGEEFLAFLPQTTGSQAEATAERLRECLAAVTLDGPGHGLRITVSVGVASGTPPEVPWKTLVEEADRALYRAKALGRNRVERARSLEDPEGSPPEHSVVRLVWQREYECGEGRIDAQHRHLFDTANTLLAAILTKVPQDRCAALADGLLAEIASHFADEERILREAAYPDAESHAQTHRTLLLQASALTERHARGDLPVGELFSFLAQDMVAEHMFREDRRFFSHLGRNPSER